MSEPIIDLHCDLLSYLTKTNATIYDTSEIGCAIPYLKSGNVKLQTMAIFAPVEAKSHEFGLQQSEIFHKLNEEDNELYRFEKQHLSTFETEENIAMIASIESASAFCDEELPLKKGFENLERIIDNVGNVLYISFTHHAENRFGGGNYATAGLKNDGKALIDYLSDRDIAIDFSHTSDALAYDILDYLSKQNLQIPILASHSNYRPIFDHPRNLPDDLAKEIIHRNGVIGLNFVRAFVNLENENALTNHLQHGVSLGAEHAIAYGADYFYTKGTTDLGRLPFYFPAHENAACYPTLNKGFEERFGKELVENLSFNNAKRFIERLWA
ncbi:dipeptidase [Frigoriflavimonas asaccharolytica]|uniref:Microsomal dipeptidase-like Zn-dependent dipeptidase n=1 Tax=Frigoriflavimonas asaccharolytica TaxID=2735899 RepID=A0A8J8K731_9FLAO|nr:membrane dipeptidase [Frigoriflavimonas asaccharolytica]NRS91578.1 microsomal dipeptidase-like Zn-dependent dipeptidase [Frigoriflavimonas asaccharolytica]